MTQLPRSTRLVTERDIARMPRKYLGRNMARSLGITYLFLPLLLLAIPLLLSEASFSTAQMAALKSLYDATDGENWRWRSETLTDAGKIWEFDSDDNPCQPSPLLVWQGKTWQGITCNSSDSSITALELQDYQIKGSLPGDLFADLDSLLTLQLERNRITGVIPEVQYVVHSLSLLPLSHFVALSGVHLNVFLFSLFV